MNKASQKSRGLDIARWLVLIVIGGMAFHALFAISAGHFFGNTMVWQGWKELLIVLGGVLALSYSASRHRLYQLFNQPIGWLIATYIVVSLIVSYMFGATTLTVFGFGIKTNLEFLAFFAIAYAITTTDVPRQAQLIIIGSATLAAIFGLFQAALIPPEVFEKIGYGASTINPRQYINGPGSSLRVFASLGGPNQFGSFLILPITLAAWSWLKTRHFWLVPVTLVLLAAQFVTFSRSAWLGLAIALTITAATQLSRVKLAIIGLLGTVLVVLVVTGVLGGRLAPIVSSIVLHGNTEISSDTQRLDSLKAGVKTALEHPLGIGLGNAGPASFRGPNALVTENYYLQLAIEVGLAGLILFVLLSICLGVMLAKLGTGHPMGIPLVATLAGISVVNLFLHGWTDSSTALVFWGAAGLALGSKEAHV
jgi:hypothetical protein